MAILTQDNGECYHTQTRQIFDYENYHTRTNKYRSVAITVTKPTQGISSCMTMNVTKLIKRQNCDYECTLLTQEKINFTSHTRHIYDYKCYNPHTRQISYYERNQNDTRQV